MNEARLIATEKRRREALLNRDMATLEAIMADTVQYIHANGKLDNREGLLAGIASGAVRLVRNEAFDMTATIRPAHGLLMGNSVMGFELENGERGELRARFLSVWEPVGDEWRLTAFAASPIA